MKSGSQSSHAGDYVAYVLLKQLWWPVLAAGLLCQAACSVVPQTYVVHSLRS